MTEKKGDLFGPKFGTASVEGFSFTFRLNLSFALISAASASGNAEMLFAVLESWTIGGLSIEVGFDGDKPIVYEFPDAPTLEACRNLPMLLTKTLTVEYGSLIGNAVPKPKAVR